MVKYYWYFEMDVQNQPYSHIGFPYGSFELIYYLKNPNKMRWLNAPETFYEPSLFYAGQLTRPFELIFEKDCICAGISLQPWMGNALFRVPANEFRDELIPLPEITNNNLFPDQLAACTNAHEVFDCFDRFLLANLSIASIDPLVMQLAKSICLSPNHNTLNVTLRNINLGRRRIEQRFLAAAGLSLGLFIKKSRFQYALRSMANLENKNLNTLSAELDYYDQSHFVHDFKQFAGLTPREYLYNRSGLSEFFRQLTEPALNS